MKKTFLFLTMTAAALVACGDRGAATQQQPAAPKAPSAAEVEAPPVAAPAPAEKPQPASLVMGIPSKEVAVCAAESNIVKRLDCYDSLAVRHEQAPASKSTTGTGKGKWRTETDTDPLTDKSVHYAFLTAESGKGRFGDVVSLTVRCKNKTTDAYINWNTFLGSDGISVTTRVDKAPAKTARWAISTDHKASFMPAAAANLKGFFESTAYVANLTPYSESPITAIFDISGAREALADISKGCGW